MLIVTPPQVTEVDHQPCRFHQANPGQAWPGCTCVTSLTVRNKRPEEWTEAERRYMTPHIDSRGNVRWTARQLLGFPPKPSGEHQ